MKKILRKILCLSMIGVLTLSMTGCKTKAKKESSTTYTLNCCGKATLYSSGKLAVSGCSNFSCGTDKGRWKKPSNNYYEFSTTDKAHSAWGQLSGNTMTIEVEK